MTRAMPQRASRRPRPRPGRGRLALTTAGLVAAAALGAPAAARAHMPPPLYMSFTVDAEAVTWQMVVSTSIFEEWFTVEARTVGELEGEALDAARAEIEGFFESCGRVLVDRVRVRGVLGTLAHTSYTDHGLDWEYVKVDVVYGTKGKPRQVALAWTNYDGGLGGYFDRVEAEIEGFGETDYYVFREQEPEIVWHAPRTPPPPLPPPLPVAEGPPRVLIPAVSAALLLLTVLLLPFLRVLRVERGASWGIVGAAAALALGFSGVARTEVDLPWGGGFPRPSEEEARYVFEALHRNVYRAFDYDSEDAIYETLAESVRGNLLDAIYTEVYSSLVLQEEGGAVCKVQKVEILDLEVRFPPEEEEPWYDVRCRWRVHGKVGHWGHTHIRVNEYDAIYRVTLEGERWKIAHVQVLAQERVDDGSERGR